jgi:hypothetical protein
MWIWRSWGRTEQDRRIGGRREHSTRNHEMRGPFAHGPFTVGRDRSPQRSARMKCE